MFGLNKIKKKISSVLNFSNANSKPEKFSMQDIEMLVDSEDQISLNGPKLKNF